MAEVKKKNIKRLNKGESDETPEIKKHKTSAFKGKPKFDGKQKNFGKFSKPLNGKTSEPIKQNWNELKKHKKELKIKRKMNKSKDMYDLDVKCKKIYEELKM